MVDTKNNKELEIERTTHGWRRSNRTIHFSTKVTPEFDEKIREQARKGRYTIAEVLELYQKAFDILQKNKD